MSKVEWPSRRIALACSSAVAIAARVEADAILQVGGDPAIVGAVALLATGQSSTIAATLADAFF